MSVNIPTHYSTEFSRNIDLLLQQMDSRLSDKVNVGNHTGEKASPVDQIGKVEMQDITTRFSPMNRVDAPTERRWVHPVSSDLPQLIDRFDELKLLTDPKSKYVMNAVAAANRRRDRHIISAFFADAKTGVAGAGTESFGTDLTSAGTPGQNVSADLGGADSSINVAKLKEGKRRLMEADVDLESEPVYCAISAKEHDALLNEIQVISLDFNDKPVLVSGKVTEFLGIKFVHTELITTGTDDTATTSNQIPLWVPNGMHYGNWQSQVTDISQRKDLHSLPWQAYVMMTGGATRLEKERVVRIWCR